MFCYVGFKWQQQLVFRSKLTMHTAYDRKDNSEPASITSLAVSKDHRTLYVGKLSQNFFKRVMKLTIFFLKAMQEVESFHGA